MLLRNIIFIFILFATIWHCNLPYWRAKPTVSIPTLPLFILSTSAITNYNQHPQLPRNFVTNVLLSSSFPCLQCLSLFAYLVKLLLFKNLIVTFQLTYSSLIPPSFEDPWLCLLLSGSLI